MRQGENMAVTAAAATFCYKKEKTAKRCAQCHISTQPPPGRRPNDKYPVNSSHR